MSPRWLAIAPLLPLLVAGCPNPNLEPLIDAFSQGPASAEIEFISDNASAFDPNATTLAAVVRDGADPNAVEPIDELTAAALDGCWGYAAQRSDTRDSGLIFYLEFDAANGTFREIGATRVFGYYIPATTLSTGVFTIIDGNKIEYRTETIRVLSDTSSLFQDEDLSEAESLTTEFQVGAVLDGDNFAEVYPNREVVVYTRLDCGAVNN